MLIQVIGFPENVGVINLKKILEKETNFLQTYSIYSKDILIHFSKDICEVAPNGLICVKIACDYESQKAEEVLKYIAKTIGEIVFQYAKKNIPDFYALEVFTEHFKKNKVARFYLKKQ